MSTRSPILGSWLRYVLFWELLVSTVNTIKIWERQNSNPIFLICLGHHFSAHNFPQKFNRNNCGTAPQTATCLNVSPSVGDPDLTAVNVHQNYAPPVKSSNGELSAVRSVADPAREHCVLKIRSTLFFHWVTVCGWLYRLLKGSQACPITASQPIDDSPTFFLNSVPRGPAPMPAECCNVFSRLFKDS